MLIAGDSGGPLMREDKQTGRYILIGLVSFGPRTCGISSFPGVYSRTSSHLDWILNKMQLWIWSVIHQCSNKIVDCQNLLLRINHGQLTVSASFLPLLFSVTHIYFPNWTHHKYRRILFLQKSSAENSDVVFKKKHCT